MRGVSLASLHCPVARTLDAIGERWTLLILRDAFNGARRFEDFAARLPIARNVLSDRLKTLVEEGIFERERYQEHPPRYEYRLTAAGMELYPVVVALMQWGNRHRMADSPARMEVQHKRCGHTAEATVICSGCGERLSSRDGRGSYSRETTPPAE